MSEAKSAIDYPWEVHLHTTPEDTVHPLYSVTTSPIHSPYWLIAAPLSLDTANHIAQLHNASLQSKTEYKLEMRHGPKHGLAGGMTAWQDGSGYNNLTGTYNHLSQVKTRMNKVRKQFERYYSLVEFRVFVRRVIKTEWEQGGLG